MSPVNIAIVGLRNIGNHHLRRALADPGAEVVAVVDPDEERRQAAANKHAIPRAYADAAEAFADDEVDAVVLAVPNHLHAPLAIAALDAGKHVLVEKPMATTPEEAEAMLAARDRSGRHLLVGMNQRFTPAAQAARELVAVGAIGDFRNGSCRWNRQRPGEFLWDRGDWFLSRERSGGGPLADLGVHKLDQLLYVLGWPAVERVSAVCCYGLGAREGERRGRPYGVEDSAYVHLRLRGGGVIGWESAYFRNQREPHLEDVHCHGELGGLTIAPELDAWCIDEAEEIHPLAAPEVTGSTSTVAHLVAVVQGREQPISIAEQGLDMMRILAAAYRSADEGREVALEAAEPAAIS